MWAIIVEVVWRRTVSFVGEDGRTLAGRRRASGPFLVVGLVAAISLGRIGGAVRILRYESGARGGT